MSEIPDDITKAARRVYDALGRGSISDSEHIARALLAQDKAATERAAKIAASYQGYDDDLQRSVGGRTAGENIAAAIRSHP